MKIPIIKNDNNKIRQFLKVKSELYELRIELLNHNAFNIPIKNAQLEALDLLTATLNLVHMLNIPTEVQEEHRQKMLTYEHDVSRMYKIIKWIDINLEGETE